MPCFPGSGSELVLKILGALTGIPGKDIHSPKSGCTVQGTMVCKTHFPADGVGNPNSTLLNVPTSHQVLLLVRNPATAIPSGHNWLWENDRRIRTHTKKMSLDYWRANRADVMDRGVFSIDKWFQVIDYWTTGNHSVGLSIPFEQLTDPEKGPNLIKDIALFVLRQNHMDEHDFDEQLSNTTKLKGFWESVVMGKGGKTQRKTKRTATENSYVPSYTVDQKAVLVSYIERVLSKNALPAQLQSILRKYIHDIHESPKIPTDKEEGINWSLKRNATWIKELNDKRKAAQQNQKRRRGNAAPASEHKALLNTTTTSKKNESAAWIQEQQQQLAVRQGIAQRMGAHLPPFSKH